MRRFVTDPVKSGIITPMEKLQKSLATAADFVVLHTIHSSYYYSGFINS